MLSIYGHRDTPYYSNISVYGNLCMMNIYQSKICISSSTTTWKKYVWNKSLETLLLKRWSSSLVAVKKKKPNRGYKKRSCCVAWH